LRNRDMGISNPCVSLRHARAECRKVEAGSSREVIPIRRVTRARAPEVGQRVKRGAGCPPVSSCARIRIARASRVLPFDTLAGVPRERARALKTRLSARPNAIAVNASMRFLHSIQRRHRLAKYLDLSLSELGLVRLSGRRLKVWSK